MIKLRQYIFIMFMGVFYTGECVFADISVWLNNASPTVAVGQTSILQLYISANEPIIGWGVDLTLSDPTAMSIISIIPHPGWIIASQTADGDGLAAIAFPDPIIGNNIIIATIEYQALNVGTYSLSASATISDSGEGFPLPTSGFSTATFLGVTTLTFVPSGACCFADGSCLNNVEDLECLFADGAYKGDGSACQSDANSDGVDDVCPCACNCDANDDGLCDTSDELFISLCISTPSTTGCENADVNCDGQIDVFDSCAAHCISSGDGNQNTCCGPTSICGACCNGTCSVESSCSGIHFPRQYCSDTQACRMENIPATCQNMDTICCANSGGLPLGYATECDMARACCLPDGSCSALDPMTCFSFGGLSGNTSTCNDTMMVSCQLGCCLFAGSCSEQTQAQCFSQGGSFQGNGSLCTVNGCVRPPTLPTPPDDITKDRYLSIDASTNNLQPVAYKITREGGTEITYMGCSTIDRANQGVFASLVYSPEFCYWSDPVIHVSGCEIVPGQIYYVAATTDGLNYTAPLVMTTTSTPSPRHYGDVIGIFSGSTWTPPNGTVNTNDISAIVKSFQLHPDAPALVRADISGEKPDGLINASDILQIVLAFQFAQYPFTAPENCSGPLNITNPNTSLIASSNQLLTFDSTLTLSPINWFVAQNESMQIDIILESSTWQSITGYELSLDTSGGDAGKLPIESISIDTLNTAYAFATQSTIQAVDQVNMRIANLESNGQPTVIPSNTYLATFSLRASPDALGIFSISIPSTERAFVLGQDNQPISTSQAQKIYIGIGSPCTDVETCNDNNLCTIDICNPNSLCTHIPNNQTDCHDGNPCTSSICQAGTCHTTFLPAGTGCDDNLACTGLDTCDGMGTCIQEGNTCTKKQICTECSSSLYCCSTSQSPCHCPINE